MQRHIDRRTAIRREIAKIALIDSRRIVVIVIMYMRPDRCRKSAGKIVRAEDKRQSVGESGRHIAERDYGAQQEYRTQNSDRHLISSFRHYRDLSAA